MLVKTTPRASITIPELGLHHGGVLRDVRIAYSLHGSSDRPLVIALGGISAGRDLNVWWKDFVGDHRAVDTREFAVLGIDFLGGSGASTAPRDDSFPQISSYDQARALHALLDELGVYRAHAIVGSSYGGMVALAFGELYAERVAQLVVISAAHQPHPMASALRSLQRRTIRLGIATGSVSEAVSIARGIAMTTYRTAAEFAQRFDNCTEVESYLAHCGDMYARDFSPFGFLCLSESIDLHSVRPENIALPVTLLSVDSDTLVPSWQMRQLHEQLADSRIFNIPSLYGHDAFLKEVDAVSAVIRDALGGRS